MNILNFNNTLSKNDNSYEKKEEHQDNKYKSDIACYKCPSLKSSGLLCDAPWRNLFIKAGGEACPSCHCEKPVGNINESSLGDIWNSEGMQLYRKKLLNNDYYDLCYRFHKSQIFV